MLLYSRKKVRYRRDGYCWKKRKDGKTTREDHMKLKVQGMEVITIQTILLPKLAQWNKVQFFIQKFFELKLARNLILDFERDL